jgi:hypothetical protein
MDLTVNAIFTFMNMLWKHTKLRVPVPPELNIDNDIEAWCRKVLAHPQVRKH